MSLRDRNLRFALLKAVADAINDALAEERADHRDSLLERYDDEGTTSFDVRLPDGTQVAKISLAVPKAATTVTDEDALLAWAKVNAPELVETEVIPAQPERTVVMPATDEVVDEFLHPKRVTELLARVKPAPGTDMVVDPDTGVVVDGVTHAPAGRPKSFSVRYSPDGREALAVAYRSGELGHLTAGTVLPDVRPAIEAGAEQ